MSKGSTEIPVATIKLKAVIFYILLFLDMSASTFIEYNLGTNLQDNPSSIEPILVIGMQIGFRNFLLIWFVFLLWSTFPFKFGMVNQILKVFIISFIYIFFDILVNLAERIYRIVFCCSWLIIGH